jgi:16S rRNA (guanine1207-N2)-methyltransferase
MAHYFSSVPSKKDTTISVFVGDMQYDALVGGGLFSLEHIDLGSKLLVEESKVSQSDIVLDVGCGWGAVGVSLLKLGKVKQVVFCDVNPTAVLYTKKNLALHKFDAKVFESDGLANVPHGCNTILLNPPQSAGKSVCIRLFKEAYDYLPKGGSLQVVVRLQKGGKSLREELISIFGSCEIIARKSGFSILYVTK